jgi:dephospho-CoA kinase
MDWKYDKIHKGGYPFVMMENAIITESKTYKLFDHVIVVYAPLKIRKKRIMSRIGMTEEKMNMILEQQSDVYTVTQKLNLADITINTIINDETCDVKKRVSDIVDSFNCYFKK